MGAQWKAKHKEVAANAKGKIFGKLSKEIMVAARNGADPAMNPRLRLAVGQAKKASMPRDTLERAIKKGAGLLDGGVNFEKVTYEGFAPHRVPIIVECLTDNVNRTISSMRVLFRKGQLGASGSVAWDFDHLGMIEASPAKADADAELAAIEAGADDFEVDEDGEEVDLEEMSLEELIEFADDNDIKLTAKQKKRKSAALEAIKDAMGDDEEADEEADDEEDDEDSGDTDEEEVDDDEEVALEDMDLEGLVEFAEENDIKLTAKQKKRKSAALSAIQEALDNTDEEEGDEDEESEEVDVFTLNLSECRSFAKDNGISLAKMPVKDRKNLDKVREYIQGKLDEAI